MRHKSTPYWKKKVWRHLTRRNTESRRVQSTKARDSKISHIANPALSVTRSNQHYIPSGCLSSVKRPPLVTATLQLISLYAIDLKKWTVCNASTDASCFPHKTKVIVLATLTNKCHTSNQSLRPPPYSLGTPRTVRHVIQLKKCFTSNNSLPWNKYHSIIHLTFSPQQQSSTWEIKHQTSNTSGATKGAVIIGTLTDSTMSQ